MIEKGKRLLKEYIEYVFRCKCNIIVFHDFTFRAECTFADGIYVSVNFKIDKYEDFDSKKFSIAQSIYKELFLMRVRSLCNVELGFFSN